MKKRMKVILGMIVAVVCSLTMAMPAFAAEAPEISVPVTISLTGTLPETAEEFAVELKADDSAYPMPEGAVDGVYTMTIAGADTKNIPAISYSRVGLYTYTICQKAGSSETCTYDDAVYSLTVYITNAEDGSGLEATAVLYPETDGEKLPGVEFVNAYEVVAPSATPEPTPEPTAEPTQEPTPEPTQAPAQPSNLPKTGDTFMPLLYVGLGAASLGMVVVLLLVRRNKKAEK